VKLQDKVIFSRQFATMINAGVPIVQSLRILQEQSESKKLKTVVAEVAKQVEGGATLANSLAAHPEVFNAST
jgi:type IV pilus assembly protein PilC